MYFADFGIACTRARLHFEEGEGEVERGRERRREVERERGMGREEAKVAGAR